MSSRVRPAAVPAGRAAVALAVSAAVVVLAAAEAGCVSAANAQADRRRIPDDTQRFVGDTGRPRGAGAPPPRARRHRRAQLPAGRAIANLEPERCMALLEASDVAFVEYDGEDADKLAAPVLLQGPLGGVAVEHASGSELHSVMDCRLVLALWHWSAILREEGVRRVEHYSALRPGALVRGGESKSGHASALAVDAARFELDDGGELDVLEDWGDRTRDAPPCPEEAMEPSAEPIRRAVCRAVAADLFQVVITPHHNRAHRNHVHLEVVPDVDWSYVR